MPETREPAQASLARVVQQAITLADRVPERRRQFIADRCAAEVEHPVAVPLEDFRHFQDPAARRREFECERESAQAADEAADDRLILGRDRRPPHRGEPGLEQHDRRIDVEVDHALLRYVQRCDRPDEFVHRPDRMPAGREDVQ